MTTTADMTIAPAVLTGVAMMDAGIARQIVMMSQDEARRAVETIKTNLDSARRLLLDLYEREGWHALGYSSWRDCATAEFGQSVAYLYRQLSAAKIERDLDSPMGEIPERQLRELAKAAPADRPAVLSRADAIAGDDPRTAKHIEQAAAEIAAPAPDLADILLRLDAHGYAKSGIRQKGITTFYSFRDYRGDHDDSGGELQLAEGELPLWLAELDGNAARAQERQDQFLDMQTRFAVFDWNLRRDGKEFGLYKPNGGYVGVWKNLDLHMRHLKELERSRANRIARGDPAYAAEIAATALPSEDEQHRATIEAILKEAVGKDERTGTNLYQQAYDHAREIHDLALHNKMIALIDRATDTPDPEIAQPTPRPASTTVAAYDAQARADRDIIAEATGMLSAARALLSSVVYETYKRDQTAAAIVPEQARAFLLYQRERMTRFSVAAMISQATFKESLDHIGALLEATE